MDAVLAVIAVFCLLVNTRASQEQNISDACFGRPLQQTKNVLQCDEPKTINISEVRFYQWHRDDGCPHTIDTLGNQRCCLHNDSRCYWRMGADVLTKFQTECDNKTAYSKCELYWVADGRSVAPPCSATNGGGTTSIVRSIKYDCVPLPEKTQTAQKPLTSTPEPSTPAQESTSTSSVSQTVSRILSTTRGFVTPVSTTATESNADQNITSMGEVGDEEKHDSGAIAGGVVGGLVVIGVIVAIVIFYRRRTIRRSKENTMRQPDVVELAMEQHDSSRQTGYVNVKPSEFAVQSGGNDHRNLPHTGYDDNTSVNYAKVNKNGRPIEVTTGTNSHDDYDHVQGKSAQFPVIRHDDYDHVAMEDDNEEAADVNVMNVAAPSSTQDTYDKLRSFAKPNRGQADGDTYNRLHQTTVEHMKGGGVHVNAGNYDYASIPDFCPQSYSVTIDNQQENDGYDLAKGFTSESRTSSYS